MDWTAEQFASSASFTTAQTAIRLGFNSVVQLYRPKTQQPLLSEPLAIYCFALRLGWQTLTRDTACELAFLSLASLYALIVEAIAAGQYFFLLEYYHSCQVAAYSAVKGQECCMDHGPPFAYGGQSTMRILAGHLVRDISYSFYYSYPDSGSTVDLYRRVAAPLRRTTVSA